jgi:hypothetical protein
MVSFYVRFKRALEARGATVTLDLKDEPYDAVLVIGGTKQLSGLLRVKRKPTNWNQALPQGRMGKLAALYYPLKDCFHHCVPEHFRTGMVGAHLW